MPSSFPATNPYPTSVEKADSAPSMLTRNPGLLKTLKLARGLAQSDVTVLICGESGTGKELLASYIHRCGTHPDRPYVAVNCAALPEQLAESELFGHEKGAFTGAAALKKGKFELAKDGTLVLDEISEMPLPLQAKLLRVLQERKIDRLGGCRQVSMKARVIAISNRNLCEAVEAGRFREDLFYRINVIPLTVPPLRERPEDIPLLVGHFFEKFCDRYGKRFSAPDPETMQALARLQWKGNVRELQNAVERAVLLGSDGQIETAFLTDPPGGENSPQYPVAVRAGVSVREMERALILETLSSVDENRTRAAEMLGISIRTLRNKLKEYRQRQCG